MTLHLTGTREPFTLRFEQRAELAARCARAVRRARRHGEEVLVGLTVELDPAVDPSAVVFASRATGEDWFAYEQPARGGSFRGPPPARCGPVCALPRPPA